MNESMTARTAYDIVEAGAGGKYHRALALEELASAAACVQSEFAYDTSEPTVDLLRMVRDLGAFLARIAISEDAELVRYSEGEA